MSTVLKGKGIAPAWRLALSIALLAVLALAAPPPQTAYAANDTITTITGIDPGPSVVGQGYYVRFQVEANPYNGVTVYGTITVDDGEGHSCERHCLSTDSYCPDDWYRWWWGCTVTTYTAGAKTITATFVPSDTTKYNGSSITEPHQVNAADTKTTLTSSPNPSSEGQSVTFTATVAALAPGSGTPTGSVTFYADGVPFGTGTLNSSGVATLTTSVLTPGQHWITAEYTGDANYNGSESLALAQQVLDADLSIVKMVKPDGEVRAGDTVVYTILVDNLGPGAAYDLVVDDTMTASGSYTVQSITPDQGGSCTPATPANSSGTNNQVAIGCTLAELEAYGRWTIVVSAVADETIDINNVASVYAGLPSDPNLENNYAEGAIAVTDVADLQLTKTADDVSVMAGGTTSWTVRVTNNGPSPAENVELIDLLPAGLVDGSITTGFMPCNYGTPGDPSDPLVCPVGTLAVDESWSITIAGDVDPAFVLNQPDSPAADYLDNDAWVRSDTFDPDNSNNRDTDYVAVAAEADLRLTKTAVGTPIAGAQIHYEYQVSNLGPSWSEDVTLRDYLPTQVEFLSAYVDFEGGTGGVPLPCDVTAGSNVLFCPLGDLPLTGSMPIIVFVNVQIRPNATGSLVNSADLNLRDTPDPNMANNSASATIQVRSEADLSIEKTVDPMKVYPGEQVRYDISVTNNGPADTDAVVYDVLPDEVVYEIDANPLGCTQPGNLVAFRALLSGANEVPPVVTPAGGLATFVLDKTTNELIYSVNVWDIDAPAIITAVHLHLGAAGVNGPVQVTLYPGAPPTFDPAHPLVGAVTLSPALANQIVANPAGYYINVHTSDYPGGEIRGQLAATAQPPVRCVLGLIAADTTDQFSIFGRVSPTAQPGENTNTAVVSMPYDTTLDNNTASATNLVLAPIMADLELQKTILTPPGPPFYAGNDIRFRLQVTNHGPVAAENVMLEDMLPEGVSVFLVNPGPGSCTTGTPGSEPLRCTLGTLGVDASATVIVSLHIDPDYMGDLENDAVVSSDIPDPNNSNNRDYVIVNVSTSSDVFLKKGCGWEEEVLAGEPIQYDILVRNDGPSTVHNYELWDRLPDDVTYLSYEMLPSSGGECFYTPQLPPMHGGPGQGLHCYLGNISPGDTRVVFVRVQVQPDAPEGDLTNEVTDWDAESNVYLESYPDDLYCSNYVINEADLSIRKTASPWKVFAGEQVMYDVSVTNHGPANAYEVLVTDTLPSSVGFEVSTDPDCSPVDGNVVCEWNMLGVGQTRSFQIFGRVDPSAEPGTVSNRVWVDSLTASDPVGYNDYASAPNLIQGRADLKVQKFGKPEGEVRAGDELTYTVIVDNLGTGYAHNVTLDDVLESDGSFDLLEVTSNRDALCDPLSGTFENEMFLSCALSDTLEVKTSTPGSGRWMLTVVVLANEPQDINNVAYVAGSDYDPDLSNNEATAEHEITAVADLELTKEAWGEMPVGCEGETELWLNEVAAGGTVTYTLTVSNTGPSTAENVVLVDEPLPLPDLLEINVQSITPSQGNCQTAKIVQERRLTCNLGTIAPEESATVTFVAHVPSWVQDYTVLVNDAQTYSDMFDDNNGNDMVSNQTVVSRVADLQVEKTQEPEIALPYWDITYTITVTNLGLSDAEGVFISDTTPVQVLNPTWSCCASDGGECDIPCEPPTCPVEPCPWPDIGLFAQADIPAGEWVIYTIEGTLDIWPCGPFTNTVELIPPQSLTHPGEDIDPCDENNVAEAVNDPFCHFDPLVLKAYPGPDSPP